MYLYVLMSPSIYIFDLQAGGWPRRRWHLATGVVAIGRHGARRFGAHHPPQQRGHGGHEVRRDLELGNEHLGTGHGETSGAQ